MRDETLNDNYRDQLFEMGMYRTVFELIRENASRERHIDNVSDSGKYIGYESIVSREMLE